MLRTLILVVMVTSAFSAAGTYDYLKGSTDWGSLGSCSGTENSPIDVKASTATRIARLMPAALWSLRPCELRR